MTPAVDVSSARIAVVGCGGLGVPAAWTLALGRVRALRLIDADTVEIANLHRQIAYREADVGRAKVDALAEFLTARFPDLAVERRAVCFDATNAAELLAECTAVFEGSDDAATKFTVNDAAVGLGLHATIAAAIGKRGQWFTRSPDGPCYRCLFEAPPPAELLSTCAVAGVLGPAVGAIGAFAARSLLRGLRGEADPASAALVRFGGRGLQKTSVTHATDCQCMGVRTYLLPISAPDLPVPGAGRVESASAHGDENAPSGQKRVKGTS